MELGHRLRDVDEHIAAILQDVDFLLSGDALSGAVDAQGLVERVVADNRPEVDEGVAEIRLAVAGTGLAQVIVCGARAACGIEVFSVLRIRVVIGTVAAAEDVIDAALLVFYIGRSYGAVVLVVDIVLDAGDILADTVREVLRAIDLTAEVVAAVDMVADEGEACIAGSIETHVGLGMSHDVGITGAGEGVEDASVAEVDDGAAHDGTLKGAAIDELRLRHLRRVVGGVTRHTGLSTVEVDVGAAPFVGMIEVSIESIGSITPVDSAVGIRSRGIFRYPVSVSGHGFAYDAFLGSAEDLEDIALLQVDGGTAPNLGAGTIAAAEDVHGLTQHVHTLLADDDAAVDLGDLVVVVCIVDTLALIVFHNLSEDFVAVHDAFVDVEDHITVDETSCVAPAVDISTLETAVDIIGVARTCCPRCQLVWIGHILTRTHIEGVPLQIRLLFMFTNSVDGGKLTTVGCQIYRLAFC